MISRGRLGGTINKGRGKSCGCNGEQEHEAPLRAGNGSPAVIDLAHDAASTELKAIPRWARNASTKH